MENKFTDLAKAVSKTFFSMMKEEGFETFAEMKKCYMWDADDLRQEICYSVKECGGDCYDDLTVIVIGWDEMKYGEFKKIVMDIMKSQA